MRNAQRWMLLIVAWSVAAACVVPRGSVSWPESGAPAPDPTRRLELQGFSIMPPGGGERWPIPGAAVVHADRASFPPTPPLTVPLESVAAGQLFFSKRADLKDASHTIVAGVVTLDGKGAGNATDLQKQVAAEVAMPIGTRYRLVRSDVSVDVSLGPNCVRYETAKEDQDVPGFPGIVFLTTARAHRCLHPQWPRYAIEVVYTERRRQGQEPVAVDAEVETFLGSLRFTPDRPVLVTTIFVGKSPNDVAVGDGDVWVTNFSDDTVSRIDVRTNQVVATIPVGRRPVGVTLGEEAVWIANREDDTISRIDRRTNRVVATIPVGKGPGLVRFGAGAVWVVNFGSGTVSRVDPRANRTVATISVGPDAVGIAASASAVWAGCIQGREVAVSRIDPQSNEVVGKPISLGAGESHPTAIAVGEDEALWVATHEGMVVRIDARTGRRIATRISRRAFKILNAGSLAVGGGVVWATTPRGNTVWRLDPVTNEPIGKPILVGGAPIGIAVGEGAVWTADMWTGSVSRLDLE